MTWNQGEIERAYWVVAKDTPNVENAKKFIDFATSGKPLAGFVTQGNYGPLNPAANEFISAKDAERMPTSPKNYPHTFEQDIEHFGGDIADVSRRFEEWLAT
jgi:putative spermidine/putrescine transport system substrate-binding protein